MAKGKPLQFPDPSEVTDGNPCVLRSNEVMVAIYNQEHGTSAKNLSASVREWIEDEAKKKGWKRVMFPLHYPSRSAISACVFEKK